jgi:hypothetical protein
MFTALGTGGTGKNRVYEDKHQISTFKLQREKPEIRTTQRVSDAGMRDKSLVRSLVASYNALG